MILGLGFLRSLRGAVEDRQAVQCQRDIRAVSFGIGPRQPTIDGKPGAALAGFAGAGFDLRSLPLSLFF